MADFIFNVPISTGFTYNSGMGSIGPIGPTGPQGMGIMFKGELGSTMSLPSPSVEGYCYIIGTDLWIYDGLTWVDGGAIMGPQGPAGTSGTSGTSGISGTSGTTGTSGTSGTTGTSGTSAV